MVLLVTTVLKLAERPGEEWRYTFRGQKSLFGFSHNVIISMIVTALYRQCTPREQELLDDRRLFLDVDVGSVEDELIAQVRLNYITASHLLHKFRQKALRLEDPKFLVTACIRDCHVFASVFMQNGKAIVELLSD